jgi:UDP-GlcNAc:undecaprenyl-phosphate GlcNAc-1-phosphate transferase
MLNVYLITLALAVGLGLLVTLVLVAASRTTRLRSLFHEARGIHERPRWGGVVILVAFAVTPFIASAFSERANELFSPKSGEFLAFLGACGLIFAIGFTDDLKVLRWQPRVIVQVGAAAAVYASGYKIDEVGLPWGPEFGLSILGPVITVLWIVFFTNAFNLIDGRDGVALGVGILAAVTLAQVASNAEHPTVALLLVALAGGGLGLLLFNLPPASVYIGDSGANLIGFIVGALSVRAATGEGDAVFIAVPVVALGFPILDATLAAVRRMLHHRHPLMGDEDHIHHRLEETGFGPRGLVVVIYAVGALFAGGAILLHYVHVFALEVAVFAGTAVLILFILTKLGYVLTLWNSPTVVWLRRRLRWVEEAPGGALEDGD